MTFPFHPVLLAFFVWLSPYATNVDELFFDTVVTAALIIPMAAALLFALVWVGVCKRGTAGIVTTLLILFVTYYGYIFDWMDELFLGVLPNKLFMPIWTALFLIPILLVLRSSSDFKNVTKALNVSALAIVLMPLVSLIGAMVDKDVSTSNMTRPRGEADLNLSFSTAGNVEYPDIYFLIFDRYADNRILKSIYGYDNSDFLDHLRGRGFYVADRSRANYTKTAHSLAATLNLMHLTPLSKQIGPGSGNWKPLYAMLQDYQVARFLKAHGYRYVHLGSWWEPTRHNPLADENFDAMKMVPWVDMTLNEFEWLLVEPMLPTRLASLAFGLQYGTHLQFDDRLQQFVRVQRKFKKLATLRRQGKPLFVFAHILVPHDPFVFFPDGRYKTRAEADSLTRNENYIDQLIYVNTKIKELVDELLSREPQPIIVIQADEGAFPMRLVADSEKLDDWRKATVAELRQKFRILNAFYFPDKGYDDLYVDITPVNTFRIIFNRFFDQNLPLLPDVSYSHHSNSDLYSFFDVTEVVR